MKERIKRIYRKFVHWTIRGLVVALALLLIRLYGDELVNFAHAKWGPPPKIVTQWKEKLIPFEPTFDELITRIPPMHGVPQEVVQVLLDKESGGQMDAIRYEPHHMKRVAKYSGNEHQRRMYASSHCAFQVMGWHMPARNMSWADLYKPRVCIETAMEVWSSCIKRHAGKPAYDMYEYAARCYNGSQAYGKDFVYRLSRLAVAKLPTGDPIEAAPVALSPEPRKPSIRIGDL